MPMNSEEIMKLTKRLGLAALTVGLLILLVELVYWLLQNMDK